MFYQVKAYTKYAQEKTKQKTNQSLLKSNGQVLFPEVKKNKGQSTIGVFQNTYSLIWNIIKNYLSKQSKQWDNLSSTVKK